MSDKVNNQVIGKVPEGYKSLRFYLDRNDTLVVNMIKARGHSVQTTAAKGFDVLLFTGSSHDDRKGQHVTPFLYGEEKMKDTHPSFKRDMDCGDVFRMREAMFPRVGIGRGAHFLAAQSGFKLWQKVDGHILQNHVIYTEDFPNGFPVSSVHSQMLRVKRDDDVHILAWAQESTRRENNDTLVSAPSKESNEYKKYWIDPEVWYHWNTNSLCFQFNPEFGPLAGRMFFWEVVEDYFAKPAKNKEG